jgi:hypothetical protein
LHPSASPYPNRPSPPSRNALLDCSRIPPTSHPSYIASWLCTDNDFLDINFHSPFRHLDSRFTIPVPIRSRVRLREACALATWGISARATCSRVRPRETCALATWGISARAACSRVRPRETCALATWGISARAANSIIARRPLHSRWSAIQGSAPGETLEMRHIQHSADPCVISLREVSRYDRY